MASNPSYKDEGRTEDGRDESYQMSYFLDDFICCFVLELRFDLLLISFDSDGAVAAAAAAGGWVAPAPFGGGGGGCSELLPAWEERTDFDCNQEQQAKMEISAN